MQLRCELGKVRWELERARRQLNGEKLVCKDEHARGVSAVECIYPEPEPDDWQGLDDSEKPRCVLEKEVQMLSNELVKARRQCRAVLFECALRDIAEYSPEARSSAYEFLRGVIPEKSCSDRMFERVACLACSMSGDVAKDAIAFLPDIDSYQASKLLLEMGVGLPESVETARFEAMCRAIPRAGGGWALFELAIMYLKRSDDGLRLMGMRFLLASCDSRAGAMIVENIDLLNMQQLREVAEGRYYDDVRKIAFCRLWEIDGIASVEELHAVIAKRWTEAVPCIEKFLKGKRDLGLRSADVNDLRRMGVSERLLTNGIVGPIVYTDKEKVDQYAKAGKYRRMLEDFGVSNYEIILQKWIDDGLDLAPIKLHCEQKIREIGKRYDGPWTPDDESAVCSARARLIETAPYDKILQQIMRLGARR